MGNEVAVIRDYDIRDRKLVDATAQSTINSTDAIEMKTTDGNQVFIDKASFIKAVGQAFTASDPKTFTKLLGMNGDGPMGIGASDLASVLGVYFKYRLRNGVYAYYSDGTFRTYENADSNAFAVAFITDRLSILIDKTDFYGDQLSSYGYSWQVVGSSSPLITDQTTAELDYNGKTNTDKMIADYPNGVGAYIRTKLNGNGYLPALGELKEIYNNKGSISSMLVKIGGTAYDWNTNAHKCSSTAYSTNCLWAIQWYAGWINNSMNIASWISSSNNYAFRAVSSIPNY